jgi:hypothetical protein
MRAADADFPDPSDASDLDGWKRSLSLVCAILLGLIYLVSGGWKVLSPFRAGELLEQARVPGGWGTVGASVLGSIELFAAFMLFVPRLRKLGALLGSALLVFFICWIGYYYHALVGQECSCFPLIKRTVGPNFFIGDGIMLLLGFIAFLWSPAVRRFRLPAVALATIVVFAAVSWGVAASEHRGIQAPSPIMVDGKPQSIKSGKVFLFFYDPQCMHCDAAARFMSKLNWAGTQVIGIPTTQPQWAASFLHDTGLRAETSLDLDKLRKAFQFVDPPYGVALVDGRAVASYGQAQFTPPQPKADLEKLGFIR